MRIRNLHIIIMLIAGIIVSIFSLINEYDLKTLAITMLSVLIVFFILGLMIQNIFNRIYIPVDKKEKEIQLMEIEKEYVRIKNLRNKSTIETQEETENELQ